MDVEQIMEYAKKVDEKTNSIITFNNELIENPSFIVTIKDNIVTKNLRTTAGSKMLEDYIPPYDSFVSEQLKKANALIIGKTAMDEFGFGSFGVNSCIKVARNALDPNRVAGGSSSGAGAFTALFNKKYDNHVAIAVSTGGSISNPAAFNSVIGITPTYGLVSRYGLIDYANSLDKIGVMGTNIDYMKKVLEIIAKPDPRDQTNVGLKEPIKYIDKKFTIGVIRVDVDEKIEKAFYNFVSELEKEYKIEEIEFPLFDIALASYYIIAMAEASTNLARYGNILFGYSVNPKGKHYDEFYMESRELFCEETKRRILVGTLVRTKGFKGKYYEKALIGRKKVIEEYKRLFKKFDLLLTPTMPILPPKFKELESLKPINIYRMDILTVPPNLAGLPHMSYPIDKFIGAQFIANHFNESYLFSIAKILSTSLYPFF